MHTQLNDNKKINAENVMVGDAKQRYLVAKWLNSILSCKFET